MREAGTRRVFQSGLSCLLENLQIVTIRKGSSLTSVSSKVLELANNELNNFKLPVPLSFVDLRETMH